MLFPLNMKRRVWITNNTIIQPMPKEPDYKGLLELLGVKGGQLLVATLRNMLAGTVRRLSSRS